MAWTEPRDARVRAPEARPGGDGRDVAVGDVRELVRVEDEAQDRRRELDVVAEARRREPRSVEGVEREPGVDGRGVPRGVTERRAGLPEADDEAPQRRGVGNQILELRGLEEGEVVEGLGEASELRLEGAEAVALDPALEGTVLEDHAPAVERVGCVLIVFPSIPVSFGGAVS